MALFFHHAHSSPGEAVRSADSGRKEDLHHMQQERPEKPSEAREQRSGGRRERDRRKWCYPQRERADERSESRREQTDGMVLSAA